MIICHEQNSTNRHNNPRVLTYSSLLGALFASILGCGPNVNVDTYDAVRARLNTLESISSKGDEQATERIAVALLTNLARKRDASTGAEKEVYAALAEKMNDFSSAAYSDNASGLTARIDEMRNLLPH